MESNQHKFFNRAMITIFAATLCATFISGCKTCCDKPAAVTPAEARAIAKEAAIYGFPVVDNYRVNYDYFFKPGTKEYKGPSNTIINVPRVYSPADTAIQTPNVS